MNWLRSAAAAVLAVHGLIHLIGFVVPWHLASIAGVAARTTVLVGAVELGDAGSRVVGLMWLALAVGFVAAAWGLWQGRAWAVPAAGLCAAASLVVCVLGLPDTPFGIGVDVAILGLLGYRTTRRLEAPAAP
ncbi:MAG TPA: hypothetical protein VEI48_02530 [Candidatus Sulfotelmatobacter sp.]|nr:hypothetical protein [Candidatus Sulfotelmatobacter sp.]HXY27343.1 hypothetical protein [Acidimicrobiales bacterium]